MAKVGGDTQFVVMSRRQIDRIRDQYMRSERSPWRTHFVEMALKTALRRLCKWLPQTVEMATAIDHEERGLVVGDLAMPGGHSLEPGGGDEVIDVEPVDVEVADEESDIGGGDSTADVAIAGAEVASSDVDAASAPGEADVPDLVSEASPEPPPDPEHGGDRSRQPRRSTSQSANAPSDGAAEQPTLTEEDKP